MTRRFLVLTWCALLASTLVSAQGRTGKPDALSGTWAGELVSESRSVSITMQLKFDAKGGVTGTFSGLPNPGEVKAGTFDAKSGALKLQLGKTDDPQVLLVFEGTVAKGSASGRVTGEMTGTFKLARKP